jgi:hypothetical protein
MFWLMTDGFKLAHMTLRSHVLLVRNRFLVPAELFMRKGNVLIPAGNEKGDDVSRVVHFLFPFKETQA